MTTFSLLSKFTQIKIVFFVLIVYGKFIENWALKHLKKWLVMILQLLSQNLGKNGPNQVLTQNLSVSEKFSNEF